MNNTLRKLEKELRSYAKRVKGVTYTSALLISFLLTGMISLSATTQTDKAITQTKNDIVDTTNQVKQAFINAKKDNDRLIKDSNLELIKLMEQGDQVVKSPWSSWQYGINYFHNKWNGTYRGKGDKKEKYPYEGVFERSKDVYERNISPSSSSYKNFTALKEKENKGKDPLTSAITSVREKGGKQLSSYGVTSTERRQEPVASLNVDANVRPKEINKQEKSIEVPEVKEPTIPKVVMEFKEPPAVTPIVVTPIEVTVEIPKPNANPFTDYRYTEFKQLEGEHYNINDQRDDSTGKGLYGSPNADDSNNEFRATYGKLWTGHNGEKFTASSGGIKSDGIIIVEEKRGEERLGSLVFVKNGFMKANTTAEFDLMPEDKRISEKNKENPVVGGFIYGAVDGEKKIFNLAGNVEKDKDGNDITEKPGIADVQGKKMNGVIGIHGVWNGTFQNIEGNLWGKAAMFSVESWHSGKLNFKNIKVNFKNDENTLFYMLPTSAYVLFNEGDSRARDQRGAYLGEGVNAEVKTNGNIIYNLVGISGSYNITNNSTVNFEGSGNIFYSGLGYTPNMQKLLGKYSGVREDVYQTGLTPVIRMDNAVNSYGDNNTILYFADLIPDKSTGKDIDGEGITADAYKETTTNWGNIDNVEWKSTKRGIHQGEIKPSARIGEKLNIDGGDSQTKKGNTVKGPDSDKWVENNVVVLAQSGQRKGIDAQNDLKVDASIQQNDPIHALYINDIDATFGKYSKRNMMLVSERGTQIDVAIAETEEDGKHHTEEVLDKTGNVVVGKKDVATVPIRTESIKDYNSKTTNTDFTGGKLVSSADENDNKAATGTILALAKGTWGDGEAKQRRLKYYYDYGISEDTINALKDKPSEINFGVPVEMSAKMAKEKVGDKDVELRPIAYMAEGGKITAKDTKAYGFGSIVAYANKFEHKYKSDPTLTAPDKSTVSYGYIKIDGNIEAVDKWAANDKETNLQKYNNIATYATGKDKTDPKKVSTVVVKGNVEVHGTAAYATNGGEIKIEGKDSKINVGENNGLVATNGGSIEFGGGTINVKNPFTSDLPTENDITEKAKKYKDSVAPFYASDKDDKAGTEAGTITLKGATTINLEDGVLDLSNRSNYDDGATQGKKYRKFGEFATVNVKKDGLNLGAINNDNNTVTWDGTDRLIKETLGNGRYFKDVNAMDPTTGKSHVINASILKGNIDIATDVNLSDSKDGYNSLNLQRVLVTVNEGKNVTGDMNNYVGQGLAVASDTSATSNTQSGIVNKGTVNLMKGTYIYPNGTSTAVAGENASHSTAALNVNYGLAKNEASGTVKLDNGIGMYGTNGSKLVNEGTISITGKGIGIGAQTSNISSKTTATGTTLTTASNYGTDAQASTTPDNRVEITNTGNIQIDGSNSTGISVENNNETAIEKVVINNSKTIALGDDSYGIVVKSTKLDPAVTLPTSTAVTSVPGEKGATINLSGTGSSDISVGKNGIGIYAEGSTVNLNSNLGIEVKDNGVGIYLKGDSSKLEGSKDLEVKYSGAADKTVIGIVFNGKDLVNNVNITAAGNESKGFTNILANGIGSFTNNGNITTANKNGFGIVANNQALTSVVNNGKIDVKTSANVNEPNIGIYAVNDTTAIQNNKVINVGNNSIGIYGYNVEMSNTATISGGSDSVNIYSKGGNVTLSAGSTMNVGTNEATGVYVVGSGQTVTFAGNINIGDKGYGIINANATGGNKINSTGMLTSPMSNDSVFIYSKDTAGTVTNSTSLTATGNENYGIYAAGTVMNSGNMDFSAGKGNVGIYSINNGTATNTGHITIGGTDSTDILNVKYGIGMAAGYSPTPAEARNGKIPFNGNVVNNGTITVTGEKSIGMYAVNSGSTAENNGTIELKASNTTGMYLDNGAKGINKGTIISVGSGLKNVTGVVIKNGAIFENKGTVELDAANAVGLMQKSNSAGQNPGVIINRGTLTITGSNAKDVQEPTQSVLNKDILGVKLDGSSDPVITKDGKPVTVVDQSAAQNSTEAQKVSPKLKDIDYNPVLTRELREIDKSTLAMYIDTSNVDYTRPIAGLNNISNLTQADLIVGNEATKYTNSKYIKVDSNIYDPNDPAKKIDPLWSYNEMMRQNPQITKWNIYSGSLTWMATIKQDPVDGVIQEMYLAKIPYTNWAGNKATPVESTDTYNFLDGLEKRYGVEALGSREKQLFQKLNSIGNNEEILFHQAVDEMMGHQYANTQIRTYMTGRQLDKEFRYLMNDWYNPSKQNNKIKVFGMTDEFKTDTAGIKDFTSNSYGVAYVHEDETIKLGQETGWYAGAIYNKFRFKDIGKSVEEQNMLKLGVFKTKAYDDNGSLKWKVSLDGFVGMNDMDRRYLVVDRGMDKNVDEIFGAKSRYYTYGIGLRNEVSKDYRLSEHVSLVPYGSLNVEYGRFTTIREKKGEMRLEVKGNHYISVKPEVGAELKFSKKINSEFKYTLSAGIGYETELGRVYNSRNKAKVAYTDAKLYNLTREKEDRIGSFKADLKFGLEKNRFGLTLNVGYDTRGNNLRGGIGFRAVY